ncbi:MAG: HAD family phosphatase [Erysipelotrichaceae bacterium]|nr:HAD family phosphatase [Erysipelotrichaceae bacterium]
MIKVCVFDMDGLLLDSERYIYLRLGRQVSTELGSPVDEAYLRSMMGNDWGLYKKYVAEFMGESFPIEEYMRILNERIADAIENDVIPLRPGAIEVLDYCRKNHILMAIATSTHRKQAHKSLHNTGLFDYFDYIITGDEVEHGKPDPEIFLKAIAHFGVDKSEAIVLEDGHNGSAAARAGGCRLIVVEDLAYISDEDRAYADLHTYQLSDVIGFLEKENETAAGVQTASVVS